MELCSVAGDWAEKGSFQWQGFEQGLLSCRVVLNCRGLGRGRSEKPLRPLQNPFKSRPLNGG